MGETLKLSEREMGRIEGYAEACDALMLKLTGDSGSAKSYDPMTVDETTMHSYAFNMKDGGRHHPVADYESVEEILQILLAETVDGITSEFGEELVAAREALNFALQFVPKDSLHRMRRFALAAAQKREDVGSDGDGNA